MKIQYTEETPRKIRDYDDGPTMGPEEVEDREEVYSRKRDRKNVEKQQDITPFVMIEFMDGVLKEKRSLLTSIKGSRMEKKFSNMSIQKFNLKRKDRETFKNVLFYVEFKKEYPSDLSAA